MLIKNLSYDCNKVGSFLNVFRVFRYLNIYVLKGVPSNPLNPPPPPHPHLSYASESIYSINAHVTRDREFMVAHNCHGKHKNVTAITKYLTAKPNTSRRKQNSFGFAVGICFCREVFGFCCEVFGFAVRYLVFAVKYLVLP